MKKMQAKSQNFQMRNAPHKVSKKLAWKEPNFNSCVSQKKKPKQKIWAAKYA